MTRLVQFTLIDGSRVAVERECVVSIHELSREAMGQSNDKGTRITLWHHVIYNVQGDLSEVLALLDPPMNAMNDDTSRWPDVVGSM